MIPRAEIDIREFNRAIAQLSKGATKKAVELSNQIALDVAREWFNSMPPPIGQIQAKRREIRSYLRARIGKRLSKSQRSAGKSQLMRGHLIIQARRRRAGQRGLYGDAMKRAAGAFAGRAQRAVGYLKVMLLPVIRALNPVVRYKMPFSETRGSISIWPGSKGYGRARIAMGANPLAILSLGWNFHGPREGYARGLVMAGWRQAADFKLGRLKRMIERELQPEFNKVNARKAA
jgi:hypothetical protein